MAERTRIELRGGQSIIVEGSHNAIATRWANSNNYFLVTLDQGPGFEPGAEGRIMTAAVDGIFEVTNRVRPGVARSAPLFPPSALDG